MNYIATASSETSPLSGQDHRSGYNFQLLPNSANGKSISVTTMPTGMSFDIKEDKSGTDPTPVSGAASGTEIASGKLVVGKNYYIANPKNANGNFVVIFSQT